MFYNMDQLAGSLYFNNVITGLLCYFMNVIVAIIDKKSKCLGRKLVHFMADALTAIFLGIYAILYLAGLHFKKHRV